MTVGLLSFAQLFKNPLRSQRNVINLSPPGEYDFAFINHVTQGDQALSPTGTSFALTTKTWMQSIDQNGYPNDTGVTGHTWGGGIRFPASSNFAGPYVITWDGDGKLNINAGTWTEASTTTTAVGNANGTTTLSGFSSVIGISPSFGISGTGVTGGTTVVSVNYANKTIVVSAAVTTGSGITFTFTNSTYTKNAGGTWTNTTGVQPYVVASNNFGSNTNAGIGISITGGTALAISSMTWSGGVVTVTTSANHNRPLGYSLSLTFFGATPSLINGTYTCTMTGANTFTFPLASNPGSITGTLTYVAFVTNIRIYRQVDEVDLYSGLAFRRPFKQMFVNLNPAAIRLVNWQNVTNSVNTRFENRSLSSKAGLGQNWVAGAPYGTTTGTNALSLAASTGTPGNQSSTPASMVHGEIATCRIGNALVRSGNIAISAITQANPGKVTATAHGFNTGDQVILFCGSSSGLTGNPYLGMVELNYVPVTAQVIDANNFTIGIDTTTFTAFAVGTKLTASCSQYVTLQVGSGNDRTAYPIVGLSGNGNVGKQSAPWSANDYQSFTFDKSVAASRTAGTNPNWAQGCWVYTANSSSGNPVIHDGYVPLEYCAALVAEINAMSKAQGISNPIHMFVSMPTQGLQPVDPDYATQSDWVLNMISVIMNGGGGYLGLLSTNASLVVEFSNETWNFAFSGASYLAWLTFVRNGSATTDNSTMSALRSTLMCRNINSNSPYASRVYKTLGFQGFVGYAAPNTSRATGASTNYFADAWNTWQGGLTPISFHDACNPASYFDPTSTYMSTTTGTGTFTDDSAMYNGTDNSGTLSMTGGTGGVASTTLTITAVAAGTPVVNQPLVGTGITSPATYITAVSGVSPNYTITLSQNATVANGATITAPANSGGNYTGAANTAQAIANFVANVQSGAVTANEQTMDHYCSAGSPSAGAAGSIDTAMGSAGKRVIWYEGGTDFQNASGQSQGGHTTTTPDSLFLCAVNQSSAWATAQIAFFNNLKSLTNTGPGALYQFLSSSTTSLRWAYAAPDTYFGGVEGAAFTVNSPLWTGLSTRNQALSA